MCIRDRSDFADDYERAASATRETGCGTAACAVGHGPAAGLKMNTAEKSYLDFTVYSKRVFIKVTDASFIADDNNLWEFAFGGEWSNEIKQAVARLDIILSQSVPEQWSHEDRFEETPPEISILDMLMQETGTVELPEGPVRTRPSPTIHRIKS